MASGRQAETGSGNGTERTARGEAYTTLAADPASSWGEPEKEPRDWKKRALVVGLGILSWVATYVGMLELIEANMGDLPILHKIIIAFSVAMLMVMVVWLLDQLFAPNPFFTKVIYGVGYVFLTLISVGFGFGFYWKVLESRSESSRSAESAVTQVQSSLHAASTRLDQLSATLIQLTQISTSQAGVESAKGASCPNSKPGDGPRRKLRDEDAARFNFASEFVKGRAGQVKGELGALDGDLAKIAANDASLIDAKSGTRNEFMKGLGRKLDLTVTGFNAFRTDPQLRQIRTDLAERAEKTTFPDTRGGTFACPDPQLQTALRGVVRAIDQLPNLEKPKIAAVEGSEATIEAFRRLTATFYGALSFKLPPSAEELRDLQKKAVQSVEMPAASQQAYMTEAAGLSRRDYIPLAIAAFVDFCLLLVSMGRPGSRLGGLVGKMREAEKGPVIQILSRFNDIHRDPAVRQNFEVFRHVVFDFHGAYYVAVPLDAPYRFAKVHGNHGVGVAQLEELQQEAHLLVNLFASFEKEKIFSRVHTPLLSTKAIQKKLRRQGSKFHGCEAFRVYRFRDGAWSELILGAVMGAARRVEATKRQHRLEDGIARTIAAATAQTQGEARSSSLAIDPEADYETTRRQPPQGYRRPAERMQPQMQPTNTRPMPHPGQFVPSGHAMHGVQAAAWAHAARMASQHAHAQPPAHMEPPVRTAANANTAPHVPAAHMRPMPAAHAAAMPARAERPLAATMEADALPPNVTALPNVAVRPQGALAPSEAVRAPSEHLTERSPAAALAAAPQDETRIVLSRTETISIPATAATLPAALARQGFGKLATAATRADAQDLTQNLASIENIVDGQAIALTAADSRPSVARDAVERPAQLQLEVVSEDDIKTLRRFAPGAAE